MTCAWWNVFISTSDIAWIPTQSFSYQHPGIYWELQVYSVIFWHIDMFVEISEYFYWHFNALKTPLRILLMRTKLIIVT